MKKHTLLCLIALSVLVGSCETPDIGVAYNPTYDNKKAASIDLNEINGSWAFYTIEAATNKGRYAITSDELQAIFKLQSATIDANIQHFIRNKMEFDAKSVKAYTINEVVPVQGAWKFAANEQKLILFADSEKSESYFIEGLTNKDFAMKTSAVILSDMPAMPSKMNFDQSLVNLIGQKIVAAKETDAKVASQITSVQVVLNYKR